LDEVDGSDEVIESFRNMAAYITKMTESLPMRSNDGPNPGELMNQIDGFPVHTIDYDNGVVVSEMSLDSILEQDLDDELFAAPKGYRRQDPFGGRYLFVAHDCLIVFKLSSTAAHITRLPPTRPIHARAGPLNCATIQLDPIP